MALKSTPTALTTLRPGDERMKNGRGGQGEQLVEEEEEEEKAGPRCRLPR
jgi:hypothetical protein